MGGTPPALERHAQNWRAFGGTEGHLDAVLSGHTTHIEGWHRHTLKANEKYELAWLCLTRAQLVAFKVKFVADGSEDSIPLTFTDVERFTVPRIPEARPPDPAP